MFISELFLDEISPERLERYLARADQHVSRRMDRMSQARQRLSKSYEIYHADRPAGSAQIVDRFEADTPEQARQYYEKFIQGYESDVDFDLRLRKGTGIMESVEAYHGTFQPTLNQFNSLSHFGTLKAAEDRLKEKSRREKIKTPGRIYQVTLDIKNPFVAKDFAGVHSPTHFAFDLRDRKLISQEEMLKITTLSGNPEQAELLIKKLRELGFDSIAYKNKYEDKGSTSYVILDPSQVVSVKPVEPVNEVTLVPSVAKSKREHLDVMPNDGKPIPRGEEAEHLGKLVAEMGDGYQLWSWRDRGTVTYYVFDTETRTSQLGTTGRPYRTHHNSFVVQGVYSGPKNKFRAADLYAFLILDQGLTLVSDNKQSEGGYRVWQELERRYGRRINIHGFDTSTDQGVNVTTQDEPDTHVARADVKKAGPKMKKELGSISRDLRFVASAR